MGKALIYIKKGGAHVFATLIYKRISKIVVTRDRETYNNNAML
jgi:hypothetical protein